MALRPLTSAQIRVRFLQFFNGKQGHSIVPSSGLVPRGDDSLLFTNAGMVQFKDYFLGNKDPEFARACSVQKCMRAGGKHNDLDNVGHTSRHHTFFEMLGNFSFGQARSSPDSLSPYFKEEAIHMALLFLTEELGLPRDRLSVTYLETDPATADIWRMQEGMDASQIIPKGPDENFWAMGSSGPCGPCTEIFWDLGEQFTDPDRRFLEVWNLVFMESMLQEGSTNLTPLDNVAIDTGMGLERIASVLQGKDTNWETDILASLTSRIGTRLHELGYGAAHSHNPDAYLLSSRVLADHARANAFLIAEGVRPSANGRGYVLRRIIRRAVKFAHALGPEEPFLYLVAQDVVAAMGETYPELKENENTILSVIRAEEEIFLRTLNRGYRALAAGMHGKPAGANVPADLAFQLYDSCGFPVDLTAMVAEEKGFSLDIAAVDSLMEEQRERSRLDKKEHRARGGPLAGVDGVLAEWEDAQHSSQFCRYDSGGNPCRRIDDATIIAAHRHPNQESSWVVMLDRTPFYPEGGGQVGDRGCLVWDDGSTATVTDSVSAYTGNGYVLVINCESGSSVGVGDRVSAQVDVAARTGAEAHHTATHLLHAALRSVLGDQVVQAGSLVNAHRLRFDFTYPQALTPKEIEQVEDYVNNAIASRIQVDRAETTPAGAQESGAIGLFSEKYGDTVHVVDVPGWSKEICGGTHVENTSVLRAFRISAQSGVSSGVRRIEAVAGANAIQALREADRHLNGLASLLECQPPEVYHRVVALQKKLSTAAKTKKSEPLPTCISDLTTLYDTYSTVTDAASSRILVLDASSVSARDLKLVGQQLTSGDHSGADAIVLVSGKDVLVASSNGDVSSRVILAHLSQTLGGKGGGSDAVARGRLNDTGISAEQWGTSMEGLDLPPSKDE